MAKTLKQLAQEAGVSIATVSKVVNGRDEHISEATRKRIRELVENSGYRPNAIAKGLKEKKTNTIGFVLPDISNPFFPEIARGIEDEAKKYGFAVVFCNSCTAYSGTFPVSLPLLPQLDKRAKQNAKKTILLFILLIYLFLN